MLVVFGQAGRRGTCVPADVVGLFLALVVAFSATLRAESGQPFFVDVTESAGVDFVHFNGMSGRFYYPEVVGSGGALFDYDADGDLDLFLVQGAMLGPDRSIDDALFPPVGPHLGDRLYRNDTGPDGRLRFVDVSRSSGIDTTGYGMGAATGDYDNDGDIDLYVTNLGDDHLWRNRGDGTFEDVTLVAGIDGDGWSSSAAFLDYDRDGWLDLMVVTYVDWSYSGHQVCRTERGEADYCSPTVFPPTSDRLFHNEADGTFRAVTGPSGIGSVPGNGLGISTADFNGDGLVDIYVANDLTPNLLWMNQGDGVFREEALLAGCALNRDGKAESSMGVDAADLDGDGDIDLFMTHYSRETNTVYLNDGEGMFHDASDDSGLGNPSWKHTAWGTAWLDFDMDGMLDLLVVNGAVAYPPGADREADPSPLGEPNQLFRNLGDGRFEEVTSAAGPALAASRVSRGALFGDLDNDGDVDVVIVNNNGPAVLLRSEAPVDEPWLGMRLVGGDPPRDQLGAFVEISRPRGEVLRRRARADGSYASANDPRILAALGPEAGDVSSASVTVWWPNGRSERFSAVPLGRYSTLTQGTGSSP